MSEIWYEEKDVHRVAERGEIYSVTANSGGPLLEICHRGIVLAGYLEYRAGQLFFRLIPGPHPFAWLVLNADHRNRKLPDAVFIPEGVNQGVVYDKLYRQMTA